MILLDSILNNKLEKPFVSAPPDGGLPLLSKTQVQAGLSNKFKDLKIEFDKDQLKQKLIESPDDSHLKSMDMPLQRPLKQTQAADKNNLRPASSSIQKKNFNSTTSKIQTQPEPEKEYSSLRNNHQFKGIYHKPQVPQSKLKFIKEKHQVLSVQEQQIEDIDELDNLLASQRTYDEHIFDKNQHQQNQSIVSHQQISKYVSEIAQLKTQVEVLSITVQHLKEDQTSKDEIIQQQHQLIEDLRGEIERNFYHREAQIQMTQRAMADPLIHERQILSSEQKQKQKFSNQEPQSPPSQSNKRQLNFEVNQKSPSALILDDLLASKLNQSQEREPLQQYQNFNQFRQTQQEQKKDINFYLGDQDDNKDYQQVLSGGFKRNLENSYKSRKSEENSIDNDYNDLL